MIKGVDQEGGDFPSPREGPLLEASSTKKPKYGIEQKKN